MPPGRARRGGEEDWLWSVCSAMAEHPGAKFVNPLAFSTEATEADSTTPVAGSGTMAHRDSSDDNDEELVSTAGAVRLLSGANRLAVLEREHHAATCLSAWWRGTQVRRQYVYREHRGPIEYVDADGNVVGAQEDGTVAALTFDAETGEPEDVIFDSEKASSGQRGRQVGLSWIKLRRVKDEYIGVTKEGVTRWSYAYTLDGKSFLSGNALRIKLRSRGDADDRTIFRGFSPGTYAELQLHHAANMHS